MKITLASPLRADEIAKRTGGTLALFSTDTPPTVTGICTDSRETDGDTMLCAIRGERVDGHMFLPGAARAGCRVFLCEHLPAEWSDVTGEMPPTPIAAIVVPDTVEAFASLAAARRAGDLADLCTVAITGSVGKTTTKEMTAAVLSAGARRNRQSLFKKDGNYNSTIGLPLSFLEIPADTAYAVLEMGMSARGEIAAMTRAVHPDIALVTNIGSSHLEHLGTRENIARAKLEIIDGLRPGGILLLNGDEPLLSSEVIDFKSKLPEGVRILRLSVATNEEKCADLTSDFLAHHVTFVNGGTRFDLTTPEGILQDLYVPALGYHMVWAAAYAAAVGYLCGLDELTIREGSAAYHSAALRQNRRTVAGVTFLEDCYNAAPESMAAALSVLDMTASSGRRLVVLGDMRELGADTEILHRNVGAEVARRGMDVLVTVGPLGVYIAEGAKSAGMPAASIRITAADTPNPADTYPDTARILASLLRPGDTILFKASRAMTLEVLSQSTADLLTTDQTRA